MLLPAIFLGMGHAPSSFGQTLALAITFLGIGILANLLIVYAMGAAKQERDQNLERIAAYDAAHRSATPAAHDVAHRSATPAAHDVAQRSQTPVA